MNSVNRWQIFGISVLIMGFIAFTGCSNFVRNNTAASAIDRAEKHSTTGITTKLDIERNQSPTTSSIDKKITLIHFNDLHAHLTPHDDLVSDPERPGNTKVVQRGGLARLSTLINQIRSENPNSVLMNIGDTFHGGVEALFTLGNAIADPVNALGIDIGVPGNWDYAYGPVVTRLRYSDLSATERLMLAAVKGVTMETGGVKRPNFPNLAANVTYTAPFYKAGKPFLPPTWSKQVDGVKLGFVGITSDIVPRMSETLATGLSFVQGESNYKSLVENYAKELRAEGAQFVFVMSELGIHKDKRLADVIEPNTVDVFFSAHTHEATFTPLRGNSGALVVEAGNDGYLGRMDITIHSDNSARFDWQLLAIGSNIVEDPVMKRLVATARAPFLLLNPNLTLPMPYVDLHLSQSIEAVVGHSEVPLDRRIALDNTFNRMFSDILKNEGKTDIAITPGFRFDSVIAQPGYVYEDNAIASGSITVEDVYRFFPLAYTISTASVSGARVKEILEQSLTSVYSRDAFAQSGGWVDGFSGLSAVVNIGANDGARVDELHLAKDGSFINDTREYTVTGCSRPGDAADVLCSYTGFSNVQPLLNPATNSPWIVTEFFINALQREYITAPLSSRFDDDSNTPIWPESDFIQPVW